MRATLVEPAASALRGEIAARGLDWIVPDWPAPASVRALVTTRNGGFSQGICASMNLARTDVDNGDAVARNRRLLAEITGLDTAWLRQVHGIDVVDLDRATANADPPAADAAVTGTRGRVAAVRVADCLPVLFADRGGMRVGVAHAGWRGLSAGVLEATVRALQIAPDRLMAWLGPAIGPSAFEVGDDVRDAFLRDAPAGQSIAEAFTPYPGRSGKWLADLFALARIRLAHAGVDAVYGGGICTYSDPKRWFSYRRDHSPARMAALVWIA
jgi:YfiH family protein